ncbi:MAG: SAM-dependent methyltransferase [Acidiphilium sp. 37-64-53]|uniref:SAM-dependent methyltransferase n=1 Tax=Acidiphilium TaxID=522 RepID=UPI000BD3A1F5|nr:MULTISPECIES: cyclopropane-fatty-acyl-phospholipid synthase family protein [Acidiphilium]OYW01219.1 MAG: SAM-dependent methyltransferase [Acidiphilium sp. 37-64-53]OZB26351.1 MAG: SAM-dependent methyltransferase [Acidiphilium sp. 34-64-41]HQT86121.1 cyclopropane-fatty-acyl-phospholipid synthase family protein [Acidiphilium rubrum]
MRPMLDRLLKRLIVLGELDVIWPDGTASHYAGEPGPSATIAIHDESVIRHLAYAPGMAIGEAYMEGTLTPVNCTIYDVLHVLLASVELAERRIPVLRAQAMFNRIARPLAQMNNARKARRNVAHHYDLNGRLYSLFLDRDRQYSCAYFPRGDETIDEAQAAKKRHIAAKLLLDRPDLTVLDIGCGWGGMALTLARDYGAKVTGITLSVEQLTEARGRAQAEGLSDRVNFELIDYRAVDRQFDRIVSVGMFEHVGLPNYQAYFETVHRCLKPDGVALVHAIGRFDGPAATSPWLAKYIFPGGYSPALSEVFGPLERSRLRSTDIEILRLHYAKTLNHWRRRFAANRDTIASLYDERFCRMFEFYLAGSELAFAVQDHMVFQLQLARRQDAVPLTRDYMVDTERVLARQTA